MIEEEESDLDVFEQAETEKVDPAELDWQQLPHSDLLEVEDADELLRWRAANVVAIIGERDAGKTTLVAEIYERFLRGRFAGLCFAGSRTLSGFERRCYLARSVVGASLPDTERTSVQAGLLFFHLGLANNAGHDRIDLLITERAGESYRDARNAPSKIGTFLELKKARTLVFLIDGERIANDLLREETLSSIRHLVRACAENADISGDIELQLVTTKMDLLDGPNLSHATHALAAFEKRMKDAHTGRFAKVTSWRIALKKSALVGVTMSVHRLHRRRAERRDLSGCDWPRGRDQLRQFPEVLGCGGEQELVAGAAWPSKA